ncbi:jg8088 [Pararge aegeria aegeria]|uniref:Jg8088 protein n=1 Tax=Pararge aegeria aegeria TaxID=348720 RepID=A0A8S4QXJ4_9NEOP|nr:jg8088 [Pararge aegeria aegeria]
MHVSYPARVSQESPPGAASVEPLVPSPHHNKHLATVQRRATRRRLFSINLFVPATRTLAANKRKWRRGPGRGARGEVINTSREMHRLGNRPPPLAL